jgi:hypothetical protein
VGVGVAAGIAVAVGVVVATAGVGTSVAVAIGGCVVAEGAARVLVGTDVGAFSMAIGPLQASMSPITNRSRGKITGAIDFLTGVIMVSPP